MENNFCNNKGLTSEEAKLLQEKFGKNELVQTNKQSFFSKILSVLSEPMFLLLIVAAVIYFVLGEPRDGLIMLIFVFAIITIEIIQEWKTDKTLEALKALAVPHIKVFRDGQEIEISSVDLVPGDFMMIQEGIKIPADGFIVSQNDLCVDESSLTGESEGVWKTSKDKNKKSSDYWKKDYCYAGTLVTQGSAIICVEKIGLFTEYGKIGATLDNTPVFPTPLQKQVKILVKTCVSIAAILFILVCIVTWFNLSEMSFKDRIISSILSGVTLAMALIPEEFPVILTIFLSVGAWRLAKNKTLTRRLSSVETLGAVSVLCVDKTGTLTKNQMCIQETWQREKKGTDIADNLIYVMGLACETNTYDPMENAMLEYCYQNKIDREELFNGELITEYAFTNKLKMMGHVWLKNNEIIIAAKGSPESIFSLCNLDVESENQVKQEINSMAEKALRVIAVAVCKIDKKEDIPNEITKCNLTLLGIVGLTDPPRESVKEDIKMCSQAGIRTVMITGDNGITASAIAKNVGISNYKNIITGDMLEKMSDEELRDNIEKTNVFSRVIPEHKMRIVKAFKENKEIVAMTGDGVNDAPALKYADIGIAMGKRGSEVAREAADIILLDDNFSTIVNTVKDGRRIYDNIRKAIGYVFTIHLPIAGAALLAPILSIEPTNLLLLPLHVVLLELIIDPTCSIVLERQPAEEDIMLRKPRHFDAKILDKTLLLKSILQGIAIFLASFGVYYIVLDSNLANASTARAMGLSVIMFANLFLVLVNSSDYYSFLFSVKKLSKDKVMWLVYIITILLIGVILYSPLNTILRLAPLSLKQITISLLLAIASVFWYEIVKYVHRKNTDKN